MVEGEGACFSGRVLNADEVGVRGACLLHDVEPVRLTVRLRTFELRMREANWPVVQRPGHRLHLAPLSGLAALTSLVQVIARIVRRRALPTRFTHEDKVDGLGFKRHP